MTEPRPMITLAEAFTAILMVIGRRRIDGWDDAHILRSIEIWALNGAYPDIGE